MLAPLAVLLALVNERLLELGKALAHPHGHRFGQASTDVPARARA
jgi:hypothetical protein